LYEEWLDTLTKCALFEGIDQDNLRDILQCMNVKINNYKKNDYISIAGEEFSQVGVVLRGRVVLTKETAAGNRIIIGLVEPGEIFGEMAAYSGDKSWPASAGAQTNCTVMFFSQDKIVGCCANVCQCHQRLILNMLKIVSNRALMLNRKVEYLSLKNLRKKILAYLLEEYKKNGCNTFQLNLNRNDLADFINTSRPSLSRELCKMRDEGLIDFYGNAIKIMDLQALRQQCE